MLKGVSALIFLDDLHDILVLQDVRFPAPLRLVFGAAPPNPREVKAVDQAPV